MKKFLVFFLGMLTSVLIVGGVAAWFLFLSPEASKKQETAPGVIPAPSVPAPPPVQATQGGVGEVAQPPKTGVGVGGNLHTNFPVATDLTAVQSPSAVPKAGQAALFLQGRISIPPELKKVLEKKQDLVMTLRVTPGTSGVSNINVLQNSIDILKISYPYNFKFEVDPRWAKTLMNTETFFLYIRAVACFDRAEKTCNAARFPNIEGSLRVKVRVPGGIKNAAEVPLPTLILNKYSNKLDPAACTQAANTISGTVQATDKFKKEVGNKKLMLVGMPLYKNRPPEPYTAMVNEEGRPITTEELQAMAKFGITSGPVSQEMGGKFTLKIPAEFVANHYRLWAIPCNDQENETECLKRAFPITMLVGPRERVRAAFPLVGKSFELARCGMKDHIFYLHKFNSNAPRATEASLHEANPPEIIEGAAL